MCYIIEPQFHLCKSFLPLFFEVRGSVHYNWLLPHLCATPRPLSLLQLVAQCHIIILTKTQHDNMARCNTLHCAILRLYAVSHKE